MGSQPYFVHALCSLHARGVCQTLADHLKVSEVRIVVGGAGCERSDFQPGSTDTTSTLIHATTHLWKDLTDKNPYVPPYADLMRGTPLPTRKAYDTTATQEGEGSATSTRYGAAAPGGAEEKALPHRTALPSSPPSEVFATTLNVAHPLVSAKLAADLVLNARAATALASAIESAKTALTRTGRASIDINNVGQLLSVATMQAALQYKSLNRLHKLNGDEFNMLMATALAVTRFNPSNEALPQELHEALTVNYGVLVDNGCAKPRDHDAATTTGKVCAPRIEPRYTTSPALVAIWKLVMDAGTRGASGEGFEEAFADWLVVALMMCKGTPGRIVLYGALGPMDESGGATMPSHRVDPTLGALPEHPRQSASKSPVRKVHQKPEKGTGGATRGSIWMPPDQFISRLAHQFSASDHYNTKVRVLRRTFEGDVSVLADALADFNGFADAAPCDVICINAGNTSHADVIALLHRGPGMVVLQCQCKRYLSEVLTREECLAELNKMGRAATPEDRLYALISKADAKATVRTWLDAQPLCGTTALTQAEAAAKKTAYEILDTAGALQRKELYDCLQGVTSSLDVGEDAVQLSSTALEHWDVGTLRPEVHRVVFVYGTRPEEVDAGDVVRAVLENTTHLVFCEVGALFPIDTACVLRGEPRTLSKPSAFPFW
jgi:hypothetical protein